MYSEVAWVLVSSGAQVQPQITVNPDDTPDFPFLITMLKRKASTKKEWTHSLNHHSM